MAFRKGQPCRREWKRRSMSSRAEITLSQYIRMMMDAESYSAAAQYELDKKRSKKKEDATVSDN